MIFQWSAALPPLPPALHCQPALLSRAAGGRKTRRANPRSAVPAVKWSGRASQERRAVSFCLVWLLSGMRFGLLPQGQVKVNHTAPMGWGVSENKLSNIVLRRDFTGFAGFVQLEPWGLNDLRGSVTVFSGVLSYQWSRDRASCFIVGGAVFRTGGCVPSSGRFGRSGHSGPFRR